MDDYPLLNLFWTMLWFFLWIMWLFLLFKVVGDIFRDHELHGWGKAGWVVLVIVLPYVGVLIYLIVRGKSMGKRDLQAVQDRDAAFKAYVRDAAGSGGGGGNGVNDLARLAELKERGVISDDDFQKAKEKLLA
ncbi:SHOCT domain-containing protein [Streptomyces sp. NBC_00690]|uniref:SHOCT domain-containing protein n=1 Tax=Streptomyces sp. NBC_00690 TaxID=2975808 RepID=UPI002E2C1E7F|nr:SHOCT domain-containing protein [Streptomyces sp. NBC_00690]